jgi:hypothetical protein
MPRGIGASTGVNDRPAGSGGLLISGVCWCAPTRYGDRAPITSLACRCGLSPLPAPEVPDAATTTTSAGDAAPAAISGASASVMAVA